MCLIIFKTVIKILGKLKLSYTCIIDECAKHLMNTMVVSLYPSYKVEWKGIRKQEHDYWKKRRHAQIKVFAKISGTSRREESSRTDVNYKRCRLHDEDECEEN